MRGRPISRRELLVRSGALAGGASVLGLGALGEVWADARPAAWAEPAVRTSSGGRLATRLRVREARVPIASKPARALTYESTYPGPTLELAAGEELAIDLANGADQPTNLHTHGLHVSPRSPADNVLLDIRPGDSFSYRYAVPADHPGGTFWYHAHRHGLSDNQVFGGLFGMLIVRGELDRVPGVAGLEERALILSQMQVVDGRVARADTSPLGEQVTLVNARYRPKLAMRTGQTQRWRLLNTSSVFIRLELEGHRFHVIAIDGNALPAPAARRVLMLPPGGRADVLVRASAAGTFKLRSLSWKRRGVFYTSMVPRPQVVATLVVTGREHARPARLPSTLLPVEDLSAVTVDRRRVFRLEEREPRGVGPLNRFEYYINGRRFDESRVDVQIPLGAVEEWEIVNLTYEPHPFHIHVNDFQVVAVNGRRHVEPHHRDTAMVPPFGSLTIRHRFRDYTGLFVWHCHILFHEDHGMMQLVEVYGEDGPGPKRLPSTGMRHASNAAGPAYLCRPGTAS